MTPDEIATQMRVLATEARATALEQFGVDSRFARTVNPLADAIDLAAELLDSHQRFLIELRNHKADAS